MIREAIDAIVSRGRSLSEVEAAVGPARGR